MDVMREGVNIYPSREDGTSAEGQLGVTVQVGGGDGSLVELKKGVRGCYRLKHYKSK